MVKIEIGLGLLLTALAGFGWIPNMPANIVLFIIGGFLLLHGGYEVFVRPRMFLQGRIKRWLEARGWRVKIENNPKFHFII